MNVFRILGDVSHALSKCILIWAIHSNRSSEGVSLLTQAFYCLVFFARYLDFFGTFTVSPWNTCFKAFYILSSLYVLFLMLFVYARTREREKAWKLGGLCLGISAVGAPLVMLIFKGGFHEGFVELAVIFSLMLESVCVLPQLLLLRQTTVPTVIDSFYLLTLGMYRGLYILNWIVRGLDKEDHDLDPISVVFGIIQTAFYIDFAWVYYSRQRVKLRHGGIIDQDDLRNGWFLGRLFGNKRVVGDVDNEESHPALDSEGRPVPGRTGRSKWGSRGISVSADEAVLRGEHQRQQGYEGQEDGVIDTAQEGDEDAQLRDPDELAGVLEDDGFDDDELPSARVEGVANGSEWRDMQ